MELPGEVDRDAAVPLRGIDLVHAPRGSRDAGVVHQTVEAAEVLEALLEEERHLVAIGDVAQCRGDRRVALRERGNRRGVHVANMHARALAHERARDLEADAVGAGRHHDAQPVNFKIHAIIVPQQNPRGEHR